MLEFDQSLFRLTWIHKDTEGFSEGSDASTPRIASRLRLSLGRQNVACNRVLVPRSQSVLFERQQPHIKENFVERRWKVGDLVVWTVLAAGVVLALIQYLSNRSLWVDEAALGLNILDRSFGGLLKPLDYSQVAPILFLWAEKALSLLNPNTELTLRLLPLLAWCGSLFLFLGILKKVISNQAVIVFALALFAFDPVLLRYSSELKQYMCDVLLATAVAYLLLHGTLRHRLLLLGLTGVLGIGFSNIAPIVLLSAGGFLVYEYFAEKRLPLSRLLILAVIWCATFLLYYSAFINHHPTQAFMDQVWGRSGAFTPWNPLHPDFWHFFKKAADTLLNGLLNFRSVFKYLFPLFLALGLFAVAREKKIGVALIFLLPVVFHILVSGFRLYPFATRLVLYLAPAMLVLVSLGLEYGVSLLFPNNRVAVAWGAVSALILAALVLTWRQGFPFQNEEIKKSMDYISANVQSGDQVYVDGDANRAMQYYQHIGYPLPSAVIYGPWQSDQEAQQLLALGGRVWLIFTHLHKDNDKHILNLLASRGAVPEKAFQTVGSQTYLFHLPPPVGTAK